MHAFDTDSSLVGNCNVDWALNAKHRKRTPSAYLFLGNDLILWLRKKLNCVHMSTPKAEYIIMGCSCTHILWMK